jgi:hypothetical protein
LAEASTVLKLLVAVEEDDLSEPAHADSTASINQAPAKRRRFTATIRVFL